MKTYRWLDWSKKKVQRDLAALDPTAFCIKYDVSLAAVSGHRRAVGLTQRRGYGEKRVPRGFAQRARVETTDRLAVRYATSTRTVQRWCRELDLGRRATRAHQRALAYARVRELFARGASTREVAVKLKRSLGWVNIACREMGIRRQRVTNPNLTRAGGMAVLRAAGFTLAQIGTAFDLTRERVRQVLAKLPARPKRATKETS